jgi:hypothetical protein
MGTEDQDHARGASQTQNSRQSTRQGGQKAHSPRTGSGQQVKSGIGSSQGQDRASRDEQQGDRPSAGTADIERGGRSEDIERGGSQDSLVNESTGAFKERP